VSCLLKVLPQLPPDIDFYSVASLQTKSNSDGIKPARLRFMQV
jgi:hypothetical protein